MMQLRVEEEKALEIEVTVLIERKRILTYLFILEGDKRALGSRTKHEKTKNTRA